ncbi:hypothetical protein CRYUN_Cryun05aG0259300 [Craigia yunnanensis]
MKKKMLPLLILTMAMLFSTDCIMSLKLCLNCGQISVPYLLSTGLDCGDLWQQSFAKNTCMAADFGTQGIQLDINLPFNITNMNTVMIMNCSNAAFQEYTALNCNSTSICYDYIRGNPEARANCGALPICCWYVIGGIINTYRIRVRPERCSAYQSFVNLDMNMLVSKWPVPGLKI